MKNSSGMSPQGVAVLVQPYEPELKATKIAIPDSVRSRLGVLENRVVVVEVGPAAWADEIAAGFPPRAVPGDKVLITKHAGFVADGDDGHQYRLVNDRDIFCKIGVQS
jgi:co-chaperonin GroES (HSP10)